MGALAFLSKLKNLKAINASYKFRNMLDDGCDKKRLPHEGSDEADIVADDLRRKGVLEGLIRGLIAEFRNPSPAGSLVPEEYREALLRSLQGIFDSPDSSRDNEGSKQSNSCNSRGGEPVRSFDSILGLHASKAF